MTDHKDFHDENDEFKFDEEEVLDQHDEFDHLSGTDTKTDKKSRFKQKLSGKFSMPSTSFLDRLPGKLKNRRVQLVILFVLLVIIVYSFMGGNASKPPLANGNIDKTAAKQTATVKPVTLEKKPAPFAVSSLTPAKETKPMVFKKPKSHAAKSVNIAQSFAMPLKNDHAKTGVKQSAAQVSKNALNTALNGLAVKMQQMNTQQLQAISNKISDQSAALSQQNQALSAKVSHLQSQVAGLKKQMAQSHKNIHQLQTKVTDIVNGYVGSFNASGATTYKAVPRPVKAAKIVKPITTYIVQAVVPGRAWLYSSNGQTLSVGVGDTVKGLGRVMSVSATKGTVTLDNGTVLKPGA